jgi:hypothetical protein
LRNQSQLSKNLSGKQLFELANKIACKRLWI